MGTPTKLKIEYGIWNCAAHAAANLLDGFLCCNRADRSLPWRRVLLCIAPVLWRIGLARSTLAVVVMGEEAAKEGGPCVRTTCMLKTYTGTRIFYIALLHD